MVTFTESVNGTSKYALCPAVLPFSKPVLVTEKYLLVYPSFPVALDMMLARDMNRFPNLPAKRGVPSTLSVHIARGGARMNQDLIVPPEGLAILRLSVRSTNWIPASVLMGPASSEAGPPVELADCRPCPCARDPARRSAMRRCVTVVRFVLLVGHWRMEE
jgi:hypothetical protein